MNEQEQFVEIDLKEIFGVIRKKLGIIIFFTILCGTIAALVSLFLMDDVYRADATVIISSKKNDSELTQLTYSDYNLGLKMVDSYRIIAKTETVLSQVIDIASLDMTVEELAKKVSINSQNDTEIIKISVKDTNPATAQVIVNVLVDIFQEEVVDIMKMDNVQVIDYAKLPEEPVEPNRKMNVLIGMLAGMFVTIALVVVIHLLDTNIKSADQVEKVTGATVLGIIPQLNIKGDRN